MKKRYEISWILAGVVAASFFMTQISAMAADKVVVIPLYSGDKISTVTSKTGRIWMDRNLGAIRVAGSKSDSLAYGWLYQWGRPADGHENRDSEVTVVNSLSSGPVPGHGKFIRVNVAPRDWVNPQDNGLWEGKDGMNNPCPTGFRVPTDVEWEQEYGTWDEQNSTGAYESVLKLPVSGGRNRSTGDLYAFG